ncbi:hypothetical protein FA95DRAFT_1600491 [Auriscalpium vulgare]|uniref:Uncharacterized protein n=1 Tax=Auriscalpium vulgare TaxID=40419 RepID=A0ACB8SCG5_9AGAM|nr:hypothetical protein FA95DRAFT_1600491 [Auriscalpium vulgare]
MSPTFQYDLPMRRSISPPARKRYSQHSKAADVSRLLDPSYLSSSASSSPTSVYVDHHGDLHDPDYRDFPAVTTHRRPAWERAGNHSDDDDASDDELTEIPDDRTRLHPSPRERRRARYSAIDTPTYPTYSQSPFEEPVAVIAPVPSEKHRRRKLRTKAHEPAWLPEEDLDEQSHVFTAEPKEEYVPTRSDQHEWTPTCGQQFRRQWQALTLGLRFSIFRAQRKVRRKVGI